MPFTVDAQTRVIKTPSGDLQTVPAADADQLAGSGGNSYASLDEIAAANRAEKYGTAGQTALGAGEEAVRTATFGAIPGFGSAEDVRGRQESLSSEHPILSAAAQGLGAIAPAAAAAATGGALGAAAGLGEAATGVVSAGLEGVAGGAAAEADQAYAEKRKFSTGNALMFGLGGEIVGRALPAALALGAGRIRRALSPLEAAAGEGLEEVGVESGVRAMTRRAADAVELPPGPERSAALRETAGIQIDQASEAISGALETAAKAKESTTGELVHTVLADSLPSDSPAQVRWATAQSEAAADARAQIKALGGDDEAEGVLRDLIDGFDSTDDRAKWLSHGFTIEQDLAKQAARDLPQPILDVISEVQGRLSSGIKDPALWGDSASLIDDLQRASSSGLDAITGELGTGAFDASKVKSMLESGDPIARKTLEDAAESLENLSEVHQRYGTASDADIERMRQSATDLREKLSLVDEVQRVSPTQSPIDLTGKSLEDLNALPLDGEAVNGGLSDRTRVEVLKDNQTFAETGRVTANDAMHGITVVQDGDQLVLRDGRHRLTAAQELGRETVYGRVVDGETGRTLFEGEIPVNKSAKGFEAPPELEHARKIVADADKETFRLRDIAGGTSAGNKGAVQDFFDRLQEVANNGVKRTDFASFEKGLSPEGIAYVQETTGKLAASAREVLPSLPKGTRGKLEGFIAKAEKARNTSTLDELKNALQAMRKKAAAQSSHSVEAQGIVDAIDAVEPNIRRALEDPQLVGTKVAKLQQTRNAFWSNPETGFIRNSGKLKAAGYDLSDIVERDYDGRIVLQSDRRAIDKLINDPEHLTRPALDALDNMIAAAQKMVKDTAESGAASSNRAVTAKFAESAAQLKEYVDGVRKLAQAKSVVERAGPVPKPGPTRAEILGGLAEHLPVVGRALRFARHAREAGEALAGADAQAARGVNMQSIQAAAATLSKTTGRVLAGVSKPAVNAPLAGAALARFATGYATPEASFEAKKNVLLAVSNDPTILADTIAASTGTLADQHPELFAQMAGRISSGVQYVAQNLPPGIASGLMHPDGTPPARSALREMATLWNTVFHPETVYEDIQNRVATSQQMRALESQHPDLYAQLKQDAVEQIGINFRAVPQSTKTYIDILFDGDGLAGPMFSSYAAQQIGIAQSERQGQSGQSPLSTSAGKAPGAPEASGLAAIKNSVTNRGTA